jgi:WD40 repeat protein
MVTQLPDGVRLLRTLSGHDDAIGRIAWSPDGCLLATPSADRTTRIWDSESGACLRTIREYQVVVAAAFDPSRRILATAGFEGAKLWNVDSGKLRTTLDIGTSTAAVFSPDSRILATGGYEVTLWDIATGTVLYRHFAPGPVVTCVAFNAKDGVLATSSLDQTISLWEIPTGKIIRTFCPRSGEVYAVVFFPSGGILASASGDGTIRLWDVATENAISILEGHADAVLHLAFSCDGRILASRDASAIRIWEMERERCVAVLPAPLSSGYWTPGVAFHPHLPILAAVVSDTETLGSNDSAVRLWELDIDRLLGRTTTLSVRYTTAKIVLVGESGVGKTGLGWRLTHGEFIEHASTHGQQFWLFDELGGTGADGTERDAILWDLAGQPDYRLIHALYLDDADLALLLFDPTHGDDPLRGVEYWLRQLGRDRPIILVAARSDRGAPRLTREEIDAFCAEEGIAGYVATSALQGDGLYALIERMRAAIRWDARPTIVTTRTFKRIKDYMLELKEAPSPERAILSPAELGACLARAQPDIEFTDDELLTAVRHLSNHGYVALLRTSRGESRILLAPVLLNNLAASIILEARRNPRGLGSLVEREVLTGGYYFPELAGLSVEDAEVLVDSAIAMFLGHSVCFRETDPLTARSYLVFPELINLRKPAVPEEQPIEEGVAYTVSGAVTNVYASLVVLLGYTSTFTRTNQWRDHARYVVGDNLVCGLRLEAEREGELDFVLYFGATVGPPIRTLFQSLFESFLARRELTVRRYDVVRCAQGHQLNRAVVREQLADGQDHTFCNRCGQRAMLPPSDTPIELTRRQADDLAEPASGGQPAVPLRAGAVPVNDLCHAGGDSGAGLLYQLRLGRRSPRALGSAPACQGPGQRGDSGDSRPVGERAHRRQRPPVRGTHCQR